MRSNTRSSGTPTVGTLEDELGTIRVVFCDAHRTIDVDAWNARRRPRNWGITYLDPMTHPPETPRPAPGRI